MAVLSREQTEIRAEAEGRSPSLCSNNPRLSQASVTLDRVNLELGTAERFPHLILFRLGDCSRQAPASCRQSSPRHWPSRWTARLWENRRMGQQESVKYE